MHRKQEKKYCDNIPVLWIQRDSPGLLQSLAEQHFAVAAVKAGCLNGVMPLVAPVQVAPHPVYGQAVRVLEGGRVEQLELINLVSEMTEKHQMVL